MSFIFQICPKERFCPPRYTDIITHKFKIFIWAQNILWWTMKEVRYTCSRLQESNVCQIILERSISQQVLKSLGMRSVIQRRISWCLIRKLRR